jgi:hypothetical protein
VDCTRSIDGDNFDGEMTVLLVGAMRRRHFSVHLRPSGCPLLICYDVDNECSSECNSSLNPVSAAQHRSIRDAIAILPP